MNILLLAILAIVIMLTILLIALNIKTYYDNNDPEEIYYLHIPSNQETVPETIYNDNEKEIGVGRKYSFISYNYDGERKIVDFTIEGEEEKLLKPNTFLKVNATKKNVLSWEYIDKNKVPEKALSCIDKNDYYSIKV